MPKSSVSKILPKIRAELRKVADPVKAPQMQAYMKSAMPYHGVMVPQVKKLCRSLYADLKFSSRKEWEGCTLAVWRGAKFREERYCAIHLAKSKAAKSFQTPQALKLYEELIVTGAWWDFVDDIASHLVGDILKSHPTPTKKKMRTWSRSRDIWKRRTAILCQLGFKGETDLKLLYDCIEPSLGSDEFFLRKGIGWALRQYAWTDPKETVRYVKKNKERLSSLSKREALKNVLKSGQLKSIP